VIPLHDTNPTRGTPIVTRVLIGMNIVVWLYIFSISRNDAALGAFFDRYAFDWGEFTRALTSGQATLDTFVPLFTHMFLHAGWLHVGSNMLFLWIFGDNVEDAIGSLGFLVFYIVCGIIAAIGQGLLAPSPMVGASGAIAGVLGAYIIMFPTARVSTLIFLGFFITVANLPALIIIGYFIVLQILEGVAQLRMTVHASTEQVAYFAHVFGFLAGILLLPLFRQRSSARRSRVGWG
jgi:membrane associated rhomboid family serine protease